MRYFKALFFVAPLFLISCHSAAVSPLSPISAGTRSSAVSPRIVQGGSGSQWITIEPFNCCVFGLEAGPKSTVWFVGDPNLVGRIDMAHNVTTFTLPVGNTAGSADSLTAGSDGNMWVIIPRNDDQQAIVKVTPSGTMTTYHAPCATGTFAGIATGPDGNLWFGIGANMIGRMTPAGQSTCFPTSGSTYAVAAGPDGNVWFSESELAGQFLGKITPSGTLTEYPEPDGCGISFGLITAGDGNLYANCGNGLARISPVDGSETIISSVRVERNLAVSGTGSKAKLYYAVYPNHFRTRHLATGVVDDDLLPSGHGHAQSVAYGADGNLWYYSFQGELGVDVFRILTVNPLSMTLSVGQSQTATASESHHAPSSLTAKSMNPSIATVVNGSSPGEFNVTGQGVGSTSIRIGDTKHNSVDIAVTVH
jgi:streptogramin lyase